MLSVQFTTLRVMLQNSTASCRAEEAAYVHTPSPFDAVRLRGRLRFLPAKARLAAWARHERAGGWWANECAQNHRQHLERHGGVLVAHVAAATGLGFGCKEVRRA
jgi:hypothetical protein